MKAPLLSLCLFLAVFLPNLVLSDDTLPIGQRTIASISSDGVFVTLDDGSIFQIAGRKNAEKVLECWKSGNQIFGEIGIDESYFGLMSKPDEEIQVYYWGPPTVAEKTLTVTEVEKSTFHLNDGSAWQTLTLGLSQVKPGNIAIPIKTQKSSVIFFFVESTTLIEIGRAFQN